MPDLNRSTLLAQGGSLRPHPSVARLDSLALFSPFVVRCFSADVPGGGLTGAYRRAS